MGLSGGGSRGEGEGEAGEGQPGKSHGHRITTICSGAKRLGLSVGGLLVSDADLSRGPAQDHCPRLVPAAGKVLAEGDQRLVRSPESTQGVGVRGADLEVVGRDPERRRQVAQPAIGAIERDVVEVTEVV